MTADSFAIIQLQGKQWKVAVGDEITVDRLQEEEKSSLTVNDVLLVFDGKKTIVGDPLVKKASVKLEVVNHGRGEKIRVATYKAKSRYRRVKGHRQAQTSLKVAAINS